MTSTNHNLSPSDLARIANVYKKQIRKAKKVTEKRIKKNNPLIYPACDVLIAKDESDDVDNGNDGVLCEGTSQTSIHRKCVSMCNTLYKNWINLMIPNCMI